MGDINIGDRVIVINEYAPSDTYNDRYAGRHGTVTELDLGTEFPYRVLVDDSSPGYPIWMHSVRPELQPIDSVESEKGSAPDCSIMDLLEFAGPQMTIESFRKGIETLRGKGWIIK